MEAKRRLAEEKIRFFQPVDPSVPNRYHVASNDQLGFLYSPAMERWAFGGNRSGKTEIVVADAIMFATGEHPVRSEKRKPPVFIRFYAPSFEDSIKKVILKKFKSMVRRVDLEGGEWCTAWREKSKTLQFANGSSINFMSGEQDVDKFAGDDLDAVYGDEHMSQSHYRECKARLIDRGGYYVHSLTPEQGGVTWEKKHIKRRSGDGDVAWWQFTTYGNPHLSAEGITEIEKTITDDAIRRVKLYGEFIPLAGLVIPTYSESLSVIADETALELLHSPSNLHGNFAIDPHLKKPTAMLWSFWTREGNLIVYRAAKKFLTVPDLKGFIRVQSAGESISTWMGDEAMGGEGLNIYGQASVIEQLASGPDRLPIVPTNQSSDKSFEAGVMKLRAMFSPDPITQKPRIFIAKEGARDLIDELDEYQFMPDQKADEMTFRERVRKVDDDLIDDLRYTVMSEPSRMVQENRRVIPKSLHINPRTGVVV